MSRLLSTLRVHHDKQGDDELLCSMPSLQRILLGLLNSMLFLDRLRVVLLVESISGILSHLRVHHGQRKNTYTFVFLTDCCAALHRFTPSPSLSFCL